MSLLSLKRNPGNFWLMAGNRPELRQYLAVNIPDLHQHLPELRYRRFSSLLILFPMESFMDAALPLPHWSREWGLLVPGFHPDFPFFFCSFPCPWNHTCETGHLLGGAGYLKCRILREPHPEGLILLPGTETQLQQRGGASEGPNSREFSGMASAWTSSGSVPGHHLQPHSGAAANRNHPGNSGSPPQQQPKSVKFRL